MASSNTSTTGPSPPDQAAASALSPDVIVLHVLSLSPEVNGGRITFPSMPLDTKISHLKSRIQNSITVPAPPGRQRLIYRGRPLLNMEATLGQVLHPELDGSTDQIPTYTIHLVISPAPGSMPALSTSTSQNHAPQHRSAPAPGPHAQTHPAVSLQHQHEHHHHQHQPPHVHLPLHPTMTQAQVAQSMLQNQLNQLQQQIAMANMTLQGHGQGQAQVQGHLHAHIANQPPQIPPFPPSLPNMQAFQAAIMQQQQMRAHAGMHGINNPAMNGIPSGVPPNQAPQGLGPITTRVHETVGPDGQRTRVVVNETTFQISRQSTPDPAMNRPEAPQGTEPQAQSSTTSGLQLPPLGLPSQAQQQPSPFALPPVDIPGFVPQLPAYEPTLPDSNRDTTSGTASGTASGNTTAWLLSSPNGPRALVFAPGHGLFTSAPPSIQPSTRIPRSHSAIRFSQSPSGHIRPQNTPILPTLNPAIANAQQPQQALEAVVRAQAQARNVAAAARQAQAQAGANANNDVLRTIMSRSWTFIKLYFVIFMFTEPGTYFRWICLFAAVLVSVMPSTTVFRGFTARLQTHIDGLVPPPPAPATRQPINNTNAQDGGAAADGTRSNSNTTRQGEPDPATTAARLLREHRQRHPNVLRDMFQRVERGFALFVASLIPGVGERHVRAREEARREVERVERERVEAEAVAEEARRGEEEKKGEEEEETKKKGDMGVGASTSAATEADSKEQGEVAAGEPLIEI